ncbi:alpha/beta fold hydrolase [Undibacterium sp.]|uniref:RBBP9/YdeN family alpha/beta hydrolase n=1 Tax=Undibacterium sp. TaxID=1914977 RepID=UPI0025E588F3|nr:alpha/beta fold hydrolase [Undibacterium sp.]
MKILLLPGLYNSGPAHWQSLWESALPNVSRVQQKNWDQPNCPDWLASLDQQISDTEESVVIVAHSLGCALLAHWAQSSLLANTDKAKVRGALLVAPPDVARVQFPAPDFSPMPTRQLPFPTTVIASDNDPWCELGIARLWAEAWGAQFHCIGAKGHINGESGLAAWPQGQQWLAELMQNANNSQICTR